MFPQRGFVFRCKWYRKTQAHVCYDVSLLLLPAVGVYTAVDGASGVSNLGILSTSSSSSPSSAGGRDGG
jgi:hypothetical protein